MIVAPYGFNDRMKNFIEYVSARLLAKNGWQVIALVKSDSHLNVTEFLDGIRVYRYKNFLFSIVYLLDIFYKFHPSVVHFHNLRNNRPGVVAAIFAKIVGAKLFFTEYGLLHDHFLVDDRDNPLPAKLKQPGVVKDLKSVIRFGGTGEIIKNYFFHWPMTHADKIIFVSKHNLPIAQTLGFNNAIYLPQVIDDFSWNYSAQDINSQFENHHKNIMEKFNGFKDKKYAVFVGQIKYRKGWDVLLRAINFVAEDAIDYFIFISPSYFEEPKIFSDLVGELGISKRVIFLGKIADRGLLKQIYDYSQIIIVPSRYEGFGLVVTEAFDVKKPLIASDVEAINETVVDHQNGLLFPKEDFRRLGEAIVSLTNNDELKKKLVDGGQETLKKFKSEITKNQWLDFYNS